MAVAKRFYLYSRKRKGKPAVWYVRFRSDDGTIGSPACTQQTDESKAEQRLLKHCLKVRLWRPENPVYQPLKNGRRRGGSTVNVPTSPRSSQTATISAENALRYAGATSQTIVS